MTLLFQSSLCLIAFYGIYHYGLQNVTFFKYNRIFLLGAVFLSLIIPIIAPYIYIEKSEMIFVAPLQFSDLVIVETTTQSTSFNWGTFIYYIYLIGVSLFLIKLLYGLFQIFMMYQNGKKEYDHTGYTLIKTKAIHLPFSFFKGVFISEKIPLSDYVKTILEHEKIHINHWHSLDILFIELVHAFFWFNPILIFYKKSLKQTHEYIADDVICKSSNSDYYTELLLSQSQSGMQLALSNQFFSSQIKNRIVMIYSKKSRKSAIWKYTLAAPFLLGIIFLFSSSTNKKIKATQLMSITDSIPTPPPPPPPPSDKQMNDQVKQLTIDNKIVTVIDKNDKKETYNLNIESERIMFESKFLIPPAPPEPPIIVAYGSPQSPLAPPSPPTPPSNFPDELFKMVDQMPRFPGCENLDKLEVDKCSQTKLLEFVYKNIKYPKDAREKGQEGMVVAQFIVDKSGTIQNVKIVRNVFPSIDQEVERVLNSMNNLDQKWIPGSQEGKIVNVLYTLPLRFKLDAGPDLKNDEPIKNTSNTLELTELKVFPNPSQDKINVAFKGSTEDVTIQIVDMMGRQIYSQNFENKSGTFNQMINIQEYKIKQAFLSIIQGGKIHTQQIIINE